MLWWAERRLRALSRGLAKMSPTANGDPQMHRIVLNGQVGPGARTKGFNHAGIGRGVGGADETALDLVDAKARDG